jgi:hypothetical protein
VPPPPARRRTGALGWALPAIVLVVLACGLVAGLGIRELTVGTAAVAPPSATTTTTVTSGPPPGPATVELSQDTTTHPDANRIHDLLQRHFNAINNRDYAVWASTVVKSRVKEMPEELWQRDYRTSRDGSIVVSRIEPSPDGVVVLLSFTSTQDAEHAPANLPGSRCTRWWVSYRVVTEHDQPRIDAGIRHSALNADCTDQL